MPTVVQMKILDFTICYLLRQRLKKNSEDEEIQLLWQIMVRVNNEVITSRALEENLVWCDCWCWKVALKRTNNHTSNCGVRGPFSFWLRCEKTKNKLGQQRHLKRKKVTVWGGTGELQSHSAAAISSYTVKEKVKMDHWVWRRFR